MTPDEKKRNSYLLRTHGITLKQYNEILEYQGGKCAIRTCTYRPKPGEYLTVDHDHGSKKEEADPYVRGLLCRGCNRFLIGRHRDGDKLIAGGDYLNDPPAQHILPSGHKYPQRKRQPRKRPRGRKS